MRKNIERWKLLENVGYSRVGIDIIERKLNLGEMVNPSVQAAYESDCGDILFLDLLIDKQKILDARFRYIGCLGLQLSASVITELIKNMCIIAAEKISEDDILKFVNKMPAQKMDCIQLAVITLKLALKKYRALNK